MGNRNSEAEVSWRTSWSTTLHPVMYAKHQLVSRETKPRGFCGVATSQQGPPVARATAQPREGPADWPALQSQHRASGWHGPTNRASFTSGHRGDSRRLQPGSHLSSSFQALENHWFGNISEEDSGSTSGWRTSGSTYPLKLAHTRNNNRCLSRMIKRCNALISLPLT